MDKLNRNNYYVYALIDPRDDSIFYIGKGKGSRAKSHSRETHQNFSNIAKYSRIGEIQNSGLRVIEKALFFSLTENQALELEKILIYKLGREAFDEGQLTNFIPGGDWRKGDSLFYNHPLKINYDTTYLDFFASQRYSDIKKISNIIHLSELPYDNIIKYHHNGTLVSIDSKECFLKNERYDLGIYFLKSDLPIIHESFIISNGYIKDFYVSEYLPYYHNHLFDSEFYKKLDEKLESKNKEFYLTSNKSKNLTALYKNNNLMLKSVIGGNDHVNYFYRKNDGLLSPFEKETSSEELNLLKVSTSGFTKLSQNEIHELNKVNETWNMIQDDYWNDFIKK